MESILKEKQIICTREVNENLRRVELGQELTTPLRILNKSCKFKKKYREYCNRKYGITIEDKERQKRYRNKESNKIKARERYKKNRVKILEYRKKWAEENPEKVRENRREYWEKNREKINEKCREYYQKNREKILERCREYYQKNREKILERKVKL